MTKLIGMALSLILATGIWGQVAPVKLSKSEAVRPLSAEEMSTLSTQKDSVATSAKATATATATASNGLRLLLPQADAVVEVVRVENNYSVNFRSAYPTIFPSGTWVVLRITLSDGTLVGQSGWQLTQDASLVSQEMWDGTFSLILRPGGWRFEAIVIRPGEKATTASAVVDQFAKLPAGPLDEVTVTADGNWVQATGVFGEKTVALLNGQQVFYLMTTRSHLAASTALFGGGEVIFTVCSDGECSSRRLFVRR